MATMPPICLRIQWGTLVSSVALSRLGVFTIMVGDVHSFVTAAWIVWLLSATLLSTRYWFRSLKFKEASKRSNKEKQACDGHGNENNKWNIKIDLPENTPGVFIWKNKRYELKAGKNNLNLWASNNVFKNFFSYYNDYIRKLCYHIFTKSNPTL